MDVAKDIPYLEPAEECEEIFYDDCIEVCRLFTHTRKMEFSVE